MPSCLYSHLREKACVHLLQTQRTRWGTALQLDTVYASSDQAHREGQKIICSLPFHILSSFWSLLVPYAIPEGMKLSISLEPSTYNCSRRVGAVLLVGIPSAMPGAAMLHIRAYCERYINATSGKHAWT